MSSPAARHLHETFRHVGNYSSTRHLFNRSRQSGDQSRRSCDQSVGHVTGVDLDGGVIWDVVLSVVLVLLVRVASSPAGRHLPSCRLSFSGGG